MRIYKEVTSRLATSISPWFFAPCGLPLNLNATVGSIPNSFHDDLLVFQIRERTNPRLPMSEPIKATEATDANTGNQEL